MDTNLNLYPDKMIAQCINAISLLSDANEALSSLKFEINEFVNDSYIHSVSFDELKKQCQNYTTVIDAMINCNEADIEDFTQLQVDVGSEELIGAIIDKWERYYKQKIEETRHNYENTKGIVSGYARVQMESYYANMIQMYETLYQQWYQKELLYYEIDGKTSSLFAKSYGRQAISNMLAVLKTSFTLNAGYNANVVAAKRAEMEKATTESVPINPAEKAVWDALIKSGMEYKEASIIFSDIRINCPEELEKLEHIISSAGYSTGVMAVNSMPGIRYEIKYQNWLYKTNELGQYYKNNVKTYCTKEKGGTPDDGRAAYSVPADVLDGVFEGEEIRDDCSSFVYYSLVLSGFMEYTDWPPGSVSYLPTSGDAIVNNLKEQGFVWHSKDDLAADELLKGDILVRNGHVEIFDSFDADGDEWAYTWGDVYTEEPAKKDKTINNIWTGKGAYSGVWRYEG